MRTLLLLRHAKSALDGATIADFDRPLSPDGERVSPIMGRHLRDTIGAPDHVLCSAASRAKQTWEQMAGCFDTAIPAEISRDLYLASTEGLLDAIKQTPDDVQRLLVVGHNPGMHQLAAQISAGGDRALLAKLRDRFPTGAIAEIRLDIDSWGDASAPGELCRFVTPKELAPK